MIPVVKQSVAAKKPTHHQFVPGMGYVVHSGEAKIPSPVKKGKNCAPPAGTKTGAIFDLIPPTGGKPVRMAWNATHRCWLSPRPAQSTRTAFSPEFLSRAGWELDD